jgi:uroporphyrinogen-III decarboxylase
MLTAINLGEPDLIPVAPYVGAWYAPKLCGLKISEYTLGNNRKRAKILLEAQKKYGYDWIMAERGYPHDWKKTVKIKNVGDSYVVISKHNGTRTMFPKDDVPHTPMGQYKFEDIEKIEIEDSEDILRSGALEPVEIISKKAGKNVLVVGSVSCPWATSRRWVGLVEWIKALYTSPNLVNRVMKHALQVNLEHAKAIIKAGAETLWLEDGSVAADTIAPKFYEKFAFTYERDFIRKLKKLGIPLILSITGNVMPILDKILETNPDGHHFEESKKGFVINVPQIAERLRGKKAFFVPFDSINLLRTGNIDSVRKCTAEMIGKIAGRGIVLSTGSPVLRDTPVENFETMIKTARIVGKYPIKSAFSDF